MSLCVPRCCRRGVVASVAFWELFSVVFLLLIAALAMLSARRFVLMRDEQRELELKHGTDYAESESDFDAERILEVKPTPRSAAEAPTEEDEEQKFEEENDYNPAGA